MFKKIYLTILVCLVLPVSGQASFYTIQLKNGNNIDVENYWDLDSKIRYYTSEGSIELPKIIIKNISTAEGSLEPKIGFYPTDEYFESLEKTPMSKDELLSTEPSTPGNLPDEEMMNDIKDRISIMEINIENLLKNKDAYISQKSKFTEQRLKLENRIEAYKKDTYTDPEVVNTKINRLQQQVSTLDRNISSVDAKITQTENLLKSQQSMKQRLQKQLASSK